MKTSLVSLMWLLAVVIFILLMGFTVISTPPRCAGLTGDGAADTVHTKLFQPGRSVVMCNPDDMIQGPGHPKCRLWLMNESTSPMPIAVLFRDGHGSSKTMVLMPASSNVVEIDPDSILVITTNPPADPGTNPVIEV